MLRNIYQRFEAWGTVLRHKTQTDPFFTTRLQLMVLYFAIGAIIFMILGWYLSSIRFSSVYGPVVTQAGLTAQDAFARYQVEVFWRRLLLAAAFMISTYFLTQFAMRPIRKSVELQQRFFATVSHELRTPLTVMKNGLQVALRNPQALDHDKAIRVLTSALEETDRLSDTIVFLLSLSSLAIQKQIPDMQTVELYAIAHDAIAVLKEEAEQKGVTLTVRGDTTARVRGNPTALRGLFTNLIENAIRHTPSKGSVSIDIEDSKKAVRLTVSDTGRGIARADLPYIFEPFYRGLQKESRVDRTGLGLGLSLVKEVTRLHGGKISVQSTEGEGTSFSLVFPQA